jgi:hypothetical protein
MGGVISQLKEELDTLSTEEWGNLHGIGRHQVRLYYEQDRLPGARMEGRDIRIPRNCPKPEDMRKKRQKKGKRDEHT